MRRFPEAREVVFALAAQISPIIVVAIFSRGIAVANDLAADVAAVDAFLADNPKTLFGPPPEFGVSPYHRQGGYEWRANWAIADSSGIVGPASLRFVIRPGTSLGPSISVIFGGQAVARLDFVVAEECETNPPWAADAGLPPRVCVLHFHSWEHNRLHVLAYEQWELPCREALPPQVRRFDQAFPWLSQFPVAAAHQIEKSSG
jgi:hypothetical protein